MGDFDNDGDLDIIVNNTNAKIGMYRNNSENNFIQLKLKGPKNNPFLAKNTFKSSRFTPG